MTSLERVWHDPSFRDALGALLQADDGTLQGLAAMRGSELEFSESDNPGHPEFDAPAAMYRTLLFALVEDYHSPSELVDGLKRLAASEGPPELEALLDENASRLVPYLRRDEGLAGQVESIRARAAERSILPVLERVDAAVDLRGLFYDDQPPRFYPVVILRLMYDESVGGSDYTVFQVPEEHLDGLIESLSLAKDQLERAKGFAASRSGET